ncbi:hypothetical protein Cni_G10798 [Canna indica]|uniref:Uncharacterized protein n=1 Tax=Canna indica TaxID=4628 RepID=A0AAQ3K581_9LILI|nr:hypothetical protein Cni_G10798 [Canna indica]
MSLGKHQALSILCLVAKSTSHGLHAIMRTHEFNISYTKSSCEPPYVEQLLVLVEEPFPRHEVPVVGVVECGRRLDVERRWDGAAAARASLPTEGGEAGVDVGVVIDAVGEGGSGGLADGMGAGENGHVAWAEALVMEVLDESGDWRGWRRIRGGCFRRRVGLPWWSHGGQVGPSISVNRATSDRSWPRWK